MMPQLAEAEIVTEECGEELQGQHRHTQEVDVQQRWVGVLSHSVQTRAWVELRRGGQHHQGLPHISLVACMRRDGVAYRQAL